jgi:N-acyl-L-homoserine lactone synthetase
MLYLIGPDNYNLHKQELHDMYKLRHKVFFEHMNWHVTSDNGMEKDIYDEAQTYYLIYKDAAGLLRGCVRFIEMTNPCMFDGPFEFALPKLADFKRPRYWELSRLAIDCEYDEYYTQEMAQKIGLNLLTGYLYFGLELEQIECTLLIAYPHMIDLYKSYGLVFSELNKIVLNKETNEVISVSAFPTLNYCYDKMVGNLGIDSREPVLWHLGPMYKYAGAENQSQISIN